MSAMVPSPVITRGILMAWASVNWSIMTSVLEVYLEGTGVDILGHLALKNMFHLLHIAKITITKQVLGQQPLIVMTLKILMQVDQTQMIGSHPSHHLVEQRPDQARMMMASGFVPAVICFLGVRHLVPASQSSSEGNRC